MEIKDSIIKIAMSISIIPGVCQGTDHGYGSYIICDCMGKEIKKEFVRKVKLPFNWKNYLTEFII